VTDAPFNSAAAQEGVALAESIEAILSAKGAPS
jgi:hypothetical protein